MMICIPDSVLACLHSTENTPLKILPDIIKMSQEMEVEIYHDNISWILKRVRFPEQDTPSENLKNHLLFRLYNVFDSYSYPAVILAWLKHDTGSPAVTQNYIGESLANHTIRTKTFSAS